MASTATRAELGSWLSHKVQIAGGDTLALFGRAAWGHDWFSDLAVTPSFQALPGASFVVNGAALPHDLTLVTADAEWRLADRSRGAPGSAKPRDFLCRQSRMVGFISR